MNEKELKIISCLRGDARTSLSVISHHAKMPISTVYDKISKMQKDNTIKRYTALVDFAKLGFNHHMLLSIKVEPEERDKAFSFLKEHSCINALHEINHGFDFCIETIHHDVKEYLSFLQEFKSAFKIKEVHEYQIVSEVSNHKFLS